MNRYFDIIVVGGGHAGCEAALASARLGKQTLLVAMSLDSIALMPCNPNIGGSAKGHLVRELDALGGEMAKNIDKTFVQSRLLNRGKGASVYALRAQADKAEYSREMKRVLESTENLTLLQGEVVGLLTENGGISGARLNSGIEYQCKAVILCLGTYLNSRCLYGETVEECGPNGFKRATTIYGELERLGLRLLRFKTGTPARIDGRTVDYTKMDIQHGDGVQEYRLLPFSFENEDSDLSREQLPCYLTYTNEETHTIIRNNLHRSPMYGATKLIEGTGARYCPSIEDKVVRFADKERHQIFIEPEGRHTNEMYVAGMSSSLPADVQEAMYRTLAGLENVKLMRYAYAIEYDLLEPTQLNLSLELKAVSGLYSAGQFNGTSGYEEAAVQGLMAGINAVRKLNGLEPFVISRSEGYIGVLLDDLVTKGTNEPYRMLTSRAEYRLLLRQDNADLRLTEKGYQIGLIGEERYRAFCRKREQIAHEVSRVKALTVTPSAVNNILTAHGTTPIISGVKLSELIKRTELDYDCLAPCDPERPTLSAAVRDEVNVQIKFEGYLQKQEQSVEQFRKAENRRIPQSIDYEQVPNLRIEARQKLSQIRPQNLGQASRISGVSPADVTSLMVYLARSEQLNEA